jgi:hypothetical protein
LALQASILTSSHSLQIVASAKIFNCGGDNFDFSSKGQGCRLIDGSGGPPFLGKQGHVELIYWGKVAKSSKGNIDIDKLTCLEARDSYRFKDIVKSSTCCCSRSILSA